MHRLAKTKAKFWISKINIYVFQIDPKDNCYEFRKAGLTKWRTHLYYLDFHYEPLDDADVTLAVQMSMDRIQFLEELCNHWKGTLIFLFSILCFSNVKM